jgi:ArsR family transcriptional regulator, arsenate/arsenite/antimonite-responsive transcriptional repressor
MQSYLAITKALSDETRVRALMSLRGGELCLCQVIELLQLAPSTVSKHLTVLQQAGLVLRRKEGRWHYYRLAGKDAPAEVKQALRWTLAVLAGETTIVTDERQVCCVRTMDPADLTACYGND